MAHATDYTYAELAHELKRLLDELPKSHKQRIGYGTLTSLESSVILAKLRAAIQHLQALAGFTPLQQEMFALVLRMAAAPAPAQVAPEVWATAEQKERIGTQVLHPAISRQLLTKTLLGINKLDYQQAEETITKLQSLIDAHDTPSHPALQGDGRQQALDELQDLLKDSRVTPEERRKAALTIPHLNEAALCMMMHITREKLAKRPAPVRSAGSDEMVEPIETAA